MVSRIVVLGSWLLAGVYGQKHCDSPKCIQYLKDRQNLVEEAAALSFDHNVSLTPMEVQADAILARLRSDMREVYDPEQQWHPQSEKMYSTELFTFLRSMPKGAMLHLHSLGTIEQSLAALDHPDCWVTYGESLLPQGLKLGFRKDIAPAPVPNASMWHSCTSQPPTFKEQVYASMLFEAPPKSVPKTKMWELFEAAIQTATTPIMYVPYWTDVACEALRSLSDEGIAHIELRINYEGHFLDDNGETLPVDFSVETYLSNVEECGKHGQSGVRSIAFIMAIRREQTFEAIGRAMNETARLQAKYGSHVILGFDIDAEEDRFHPISYYVPEFVDMEPPLKWFFHAGETDRDLHYIDNVFSAVALNTHRIGHGFSLREFPSLQSQLRAKHIGVEVCPLSNQILRLVNSMTQHVAPALAAAGVPVSISSDDPIIYAYNGTTPDWLVTTCAWNLTLSWIKQACLESLRTAAGPANTPQAQSEWASAWNSWIEWVVQSFSP